MAQTRSRISAAGDRMVVRAAIHPAIGIGRIGNSVDGFFYGPEVSYPTPADPGFYRDAIGALKRQAARFRVYGYNAAGAVVAELTAANASITWSVHLRNEKAAWYEFQLAMDIPEVAEAKPAKRRNFAVTSNDRAKLAIDGGTLRISGASISGPAYRFKGEFFGIPVSLGELRTDEAGRLIILGGQGVSGSYAHQPLKSFSDNDGWHDDISDGPVTAVVTMDGQAVPVDPAWVVIAPPNYAPNLKTVRTMYDLLFDLFVQSGQLSAPNPVSFSRDILPIFQRMSGLQWVNEGFARAFGYGAPLDFADPQFLLQMSRTDSNIELRRQIANSFREFAVDGYSRTPLPWIYGDAVSIKSMPVIHQNCALSPTQLNCLRQWGRGEFVSDYQPMATPPGSLDQVPLAEQPAMLDRAALEFCLADAFHPGCEITWPIRHTTMFMAPFRIRHRHHSAPVDYGDVLTPAVALGAGGPLYAQGAGGLSRWMAVPWQADTASCRSGYDPDYDPYLPTFWPARVPNQILYEPDYLIAIDPTHPREARLAAFNCRPNWYDAIPGGNYAEQLAAMISCFPYLGIVEQRPGVIDDPNLPPTMQVSTLPLLLKLPLEAGGTIDQPLAAAAEAHARAIAAPRAELSDPWAGRFAWRKSDNGS
jgi:L-Lysine epsilon oxidase N-terminal/L-lysine epsilon oxidase C-terminal domain